MKAIYLFSIVVLALSACNKEKTGATQTAIVFSEPGQGDTILSYNQIHTEGTITADGMMEGYTVKLIHSQNGTVLFANNYDIQADDYNFHEHWTNNLIDTTEVIVRVEVKKDKNGNQDTKEIRVVCLP